MKAHGKHTPEGWKEEAVQTFGEQQIARVSTGFKITGEIEGTAKTEYVMYYEKTDPKDMHNAAAQYIGYARFEGTVNGKKGSFVIRDTGTYGGGEAKSELAIVEGSGTGELAGIRGSGRYVASQTEMVYELEYEIAVH
jgi:hypothetical protein